MVKYKLDAVALIRAGQMPERVGRIAGLNGVEPVHSPQSGHKPPRLPITVCEFAHETELS